MTPAELLVDPRAGLIKRLVTLPPQPGLPRSDVSVGADVAHTETFADWLADRLAHGAALGDPQAAADAALGEAVERYCGNTVPNDLPYETGTTLARRGRAVLDPAELALYSDRRHPHADPTGRTATPAAAPTALTRPALDRLTGGDDTGCSHSDRSGCSGLPTPCPQPAAQSPRPSCRSCSTS
ncbi:MAG: hypothetical protein ACRDQY_12940 [Pseudonocardiaceae bacterium]